jgi:hypothetical protein
MGATVGSKLYLIERRSMSAGKETWTTVSVSTNSTDALKTCRKHAQADSRGSYRSVEFSYNRVSATVHGAGVRI